uniref:Uncharacterized protein n=1 Tax=Megaselia scalaris TaxID=36166 RepID=T1GL50_MEGSC
MKFVLYTKRYLICSAAQLEVEYRNDKEKQRWALSVIYKHVFLDHCILTTIPERQQWCTNQVLGVGELENQSVDLIANKEEILMQEEDFFKELLNDNESRTSSQRNQS